MSYGVSGDSLNPFTDKIPHHTKSSNGFTFRHEEAGALPSGGEAHLTDQLGRVRRKLRPWKLALDQAASSWSEILLNSYCLRTRGSFNDARLGSALVVATAD